jgi:hypothetical protein
MAYLPALSMADSGGEGKGKKATSRHGVLEKLKISYPK